MSGPIIAQGLHAPAMAAIHAAAFPPAEAWDAANIKTLLEQPGVIGLVDPAGAMVLARIAADEAEILTLGVAPAARRQGRALALLGATIARIRCVGAYSLFLEVAADNLPARALYNRAGFTEIGSRVHYYASGADALVLRLDLTGVEAKGA